MKTQEPARFRSGRQLAAWAGLTPKDHSTAGKLRSGRITRADDEGLRSALVVGATAIIMHHRRFWRQRIKISARHGEQLIRNHAELMPEFAR